MAPTAPPAADPPALLEEFARLAVSLPAFSPGHCPVEASRYLVFYRLDMGPEFPGVRHGLGFIRSGEHRLALHCWEQADAGDTLVLVHGYFDHVGLFDHLVRYGLRRGLNVVAFDLPGHGLSSGPQAEISDFSEYRQALVDVLQSVGFLPGARYVIAQSTGAAAVMDYLLSGESPQLDQVILLAPLVRPAQWRRIVFAHRLLRRVVRQVPRRFADSSQDPQFLDFVRGDPLQSPVIPVCWITALRRWIPRFLAAVPSTQRLLVIQGDDDMTVDWRYNLAQIRRLFPELDLFMIPGGRHHLANEHADLRDAYFGVIDGFLDSGMRGLRDAEHHGS